MQTTTESVGRRVRQARAGLGWSQMDLAVASGLSMQTIFRVEKGTQSPGSRTLHDLAVALDTTTDHLLEGD